MSKVDCSWGGSVLGESSRTVCLEVLSGCHTSSQGFQQLFRRYQLRTTKGKTQACSRLRELLMPPGNDTDEDSDGDKDPDEDFHFH
jgi:hypothetical protein